MTVISTRNLASLPHPTALRDLMRSMAMLDAILCQDWDLVISLNPEIGIDDIEDDIQEIGYLAQ